MNKNTHHCCITGHCFILLSINPDSCFRTHEIDDCFEISNFPASQKNVGYNLAHWFLKVPAKHLIK